MTLLESLIIVSEKAANIARICREEEKLFSLLIQEKKFDESNPRFIQDFKTLADVLIQEMIKNDIGKKFPELKNFISGEENNIFQNTLGEIVEIEVKDNEKNTIELLEKVLNGNTEVAKILAHEIYTTIEMKDINVLLSSENIDLDNNNLGIWIDPIDSTSEYISGKEEKDKNGIFLKGLKCVTVLIGVFCRKTGYPVMGVINQPFFEFDGSSWKGKCLWGLPSKRINSLPQNLNVEITNRICLSSSEGEDIKKKLFDNNFDVIEAAGAGYKLLLVITGIVDAYVLTKGTTFFWDTCGPHAILQSLGGDVVHCEDRSVITYRSIDTGENKIQLCCNYKGIIATKNMETMSKLQEILLSNN